MKKTKSQIKTTNFLLWPLRVIAAVLCVLVVSYVLTVREEVVQVTEPHKAQVSFTFDDGFDNTFTEAAPILSKHGLKGVVYISTGCIDGSGACRDNVGGAAKFMTWQQLKQLQNQYKWEIASHSVTHPLLSELPEQEVEKELSLSKKILEGHGFPITNFASPYGDYNYETLAIASKYYASHRGFRDMNKNIWPYNNTILQVKQVQAEISVEEVKAEIDTAIARNQWLILVFHQVKDRASSFEEDYELATYKFEQIAAYVKEQQDVGAIENVTIAEGLQMNSGNMFPNGSFEERFPKDWITDDPANVMRETKNGSFPTPDNSIKFVGNGKNIHLYSPSIPVTFSNIYTLKAYVNALEKKKGEFGFFIDEYDASGKWISGKWLGSIKDPIVTYFTAEYTPSSRKVASTKVQTFFTKNSQGTVYVDNYALYGIKNP